MGWGRFIFGEGSLRQCSFVYLDSKLTLKPCDYLCSSQLSCPNSSHPNVALRYRTQMGILSAVLHPVKLETVTLVAEKTKGCVYLVIYKAHHIEIHHLQS